MLSARPVVSARPVAKATVARRVTVRAEPLDAKVADAVKNAEETCKDGASGECAAAWDEVEELSAAASHKKAAVAEDPLEKYCESAPDADECRVYED